jgi:hypothetical protein
MDRDDGQDIRHYDSAEAIAASQQVGDEAPSGVRESGQQGSTVDDPRPDGGIDPDETRYVNTAEGFSVGGTGAGIETDATTDVEPDDASPVDDDEAADVYDEPSASLDFDPDDDPLGMGTDDSDDMVTDDH